MKRYFLISHVRVCTYSTYIYLANHPAVVLLIPLILQSAAKTLQSRHFRLTVQSVSH